MKRQIKPRHEKSTEERIADAGWFPGTERDWQALSSAERSELSFAATGCLVAYATWPAPVDCVHGWCQVRRGERKPITILNAALKHEAQSGWWRDLPRPKLAKLYRAYRKAAREHQVYDIWKLGWQTVVFSGLEV